MARATKVLGTETFLSGAMVEVMRLHGYKGTHNQFRIICRSSGVKNANELCAANGLSGRVFAPSYTSQTFNENELALAEEYPIWICTSGVACGEKYIRLDELAKEAEKIKQNRGT